MARENHEHQLKTRKRGFRLSCVISSASDSMDHVARKYYEQQLEGRKRVCVEVDTKRVYE